MNFNVTNMLQTCYISVKKWKRCRIAMGGFGGLWFLGVDWNFWVYMPSREIEINIETSVRNVSQNRLWGLSGVMVHNLVSRRLKSHFLTIFIFTSFYGYIIHLNAVSCRHYWYFVSNKVTRYYKNMSKIDLAINWDFVSYLESDIKKGQGFYSWPPPFCCFGLFNRQLPAQSILR